MDVKRLTLAAVSAWFVDVFLGIILQTVLLGREIEKFPGVFRSQASMNEQVPILFAGGLIAMFVLTYLYATGSRQHDVRHGLRFGVLVAVFTSGVASVGIYASFSISARVAVLASVAWFLKMVVAGGVIGRLYRPLAPAATTTVRMAA
jgi:hypothetical protein